MGGFRRGSGEVVVMATSVCLGECEDESERERMKEKRETDRQKERMSRCRFIALMKFII